MQRTFNEAIRTTLEQSMDEDPSILLLGLGVDDPKRVFGTTTGLLEKFGSRRIIECPTSENAYLGHALGLALGGYTPVIHFQRMDFMLYAFDQLINNVAKWAHMFPDSQVKPIVMRAIVGMGWGQGAQHSQNLAPILAQIPGLNIVAPSCPLSAASLLKQALHSPTPTIITEHRWLQFLNQDVKANIDFSIGKAFKRSEGKDLTIVTWSYGTAEILRIKQMFPEQSWDIIDLLSLQPLDIQSIRESYQKTGNLLVWEPGWSFGGIGAEILSQLSSLDGQAKRRGYPMSYPSASPKEVQEFYPTLGNFVDCLNQNFNLKLKLRPEHLSRWPLDQDPSHWSPWT